MSAIKITFPIVPDEDGYPPFTVEDVWASSTDVPLHFIVDNIPFFARQATLGDTVKIIESGEGFLFDELVAPSSNSLIRVVVFEPTVVDEVRAELKRLGCSTESFKGIKILAVNVPATASLHAVQEYLQALEVRDVASYEEPILRHPQPT